VLALVRELPMPADGSLIESQEALSGSLTEEIKGGDIPERAEPALSACEVVFASG